MDEMMARTEMILGAPSCEKLNKAHVAVFGLGGVGGYTVEALVRAGVGHLTVVDFDTVDITNLNRQILATRETVGRKKTEVAKERILSINPDCDVRVYDMFYLPETQGELDFSEFSYVADCVDTVTAKLLIIENARKAGVPVISSMGTGNKLLTVPFEVATIEKTSVCPLAKVMRRELKKRDIRHVKVVYSKEEAIDVGGRTPGSVSFVPGTAGLLLAGEIIKDLTKRETANEV